MTKPHPPGKPEAKMRPESWSPVWLIVHHVSQHFICFEPLSASSIQLMCWDIAAGVI